MKIPKAEVVLLDQIAGTPVSIVADGAISTSGTHGGRLVPLVILDTSQRPDIEELIRVHHLFRVPGDVRVQWGKFEGKDDTVLLYLTFIRPSELSLTIEFKIIGQGILVDQALRGRGLYIQAGKPGDRLRDDLARPKVLLEIGEFGYEKIWESTWTKQLTKHFRTNRLSRGESKRAALKTIEELRAFGSFRIRDA